MTGTAARWNDRGNQPSAHPCCRMAGCTNTPVTGVRHEGDRDLCEYHLAVVRRRRAATPLADNHHQARTGRHAAAAHQ